MFGLCVAEMNMFMPVFSFTMWILLLGLRLVAIELLGQAHSYKVSCSPKDALNLHFHPCTGTVS